ncbi:MAG TPA: MMPL family transporter [Solirubrobacteraceae bacterium]
MLVAWLFIAVGGTLLSSSVGSNFNASFTLKGVDSTRAIALLQRSAPAASGSSNQIVIATPTGKVTDPAVRQSVRAMLARVRTVPHVGSVISPYAPGAANQISRDRSVEFATVTFDQESDKIPLTDVKQVVAVAKSAASPSVNVQLGGEAIGRTNQAGTGGLPIGMGLALIVLLIVFGSLLAAALPLIVAGVALATGVAAMGLLSHVISMPDFSSQLALLIGLGVGVDYALFIVTRYRQALMRGVSSEEAVIEALDTSGRAVLFAGMTVGIALLGMLALGVSLLSGAGIASSIVVAFTVLAALTLLPALLGFFGTRTLTRRARRALAAGELRTSDESPGWARWAGILQRRPALFAAGAAALMLVVATPFLSMRVGSSDAGSDPASSTTRQAYDLLAKGFGPGFNGPLQLVASVNGPGQPRQFKQVLTAVGHTRNVVSVSPATVVGGGVATAQVFPEGSPQAASTSDLLTTLRSRVIPAASQHKVHVLVGGQTAVFADFSTILSGKLPLFIGVVVLLSFVLLMAVFRSIAIPVMAAMMNLLSVGAAFGVVTAVFQDGWLLSLIGENRTGPIQAFLPVIVFAILFGLSMDYEVFLVSRIYEEWHRRRDNTDAVVHGLAATGRTITAAAAIMVLVFGAFILGGEHVIKLFGVGLAAAVLMDALIVRSILIPGLMLTLGKTNWALPKSLDRVLPRLKVEGQGEKAQPRGAHAPSIRPQPQPEAS